MIDYLNKFNELPSDLKEAVSSPEAVAAITELEAEYGVSLATAAMRVMVKDISIVDLAKYFVFEHGMDARQAEGLVEELKNRVFANAADYLGFARPAGVETGPSAGLPSTRFGADGPDRTASDLDGWLEDRKSDTAVRGSSFFFSPEDEEEVRNLALKLNQGLAAKGSKDREAGQGPVTVIEQPARLDKQCQEMADAAVAELKYNFSSSDLNARFRNILYTFIKGIRNRVDAKETLMKDVEVGGLGLNATFSDKALDTAQRIMLGGGKTPVPSRAEGPITLSSIQVEKAEEKGGLTETTKASDKTMMYDERDLPYDFSKFTPENTPSTPINTPSTPSEGTKDEDRPEVDEKPPVLDLRVPEAPAPARQEEPQEPAAIDPEPIAPLPPAPEPEPEPKPAPRTMPAMAQPPKAEDKSGRVKVTDVKFVPKLMGPVDELKDLDLVNFRRLSPDPKAAAAKIKEKLAFLEEDNYGQRLAGIKAWRQSPANRSYLAIGRASIERGQSVDTVIKEALEHGEDCLTKQEFVAIMDLNKELRF